MQHFLSIPLGEIVMNREARHQLSSVFGAFQAKTHSHPFVFLFGRSGSGKNMLLTHLAHSHQLKVINEKHYDAEHQNNRFTHDEYFNLAISTRLPDQKSVVVLQNLPSRQYLSRKENQRRLREYSQRKSRPLVILVCNLSIHYPKHVHALFPDSLVSRCLLLSFKTYSDSQMKQILLQYLDHRKVSPRHCQDSLQSIVDSAQGDAR